MLESIETPWLRRPLCLVGLFPSNAISSSVTFKSNLDGHRPSTLPYYSHLVSRPPLCLTILTSSNLSNVLPSRPLLQTPTRPLFTSKYPITDKPSLFWFPSRAPLRFQHYIYTCSERSKPGQEARFYTGRRYWVSKRWKLSFWLINTVRHEVSNLFVDNLILITITAIISCDKQKWRYIWNKRQFTSL